VGRGPLTVVLIAILLLVAPLQVLAQAGPDLTYEEWCSRLDALHEEFSRATSEWSIYSTLAEPLGYALVLLALLPLMAVDEILISPDTPLWVSIPVGVLAVAVGILGAAYVLFRISEMPQERPPAEIAKEIDNLEQAGLYRMWFYPCETY